MLTIHVMARFGPWTLLRVEDLMRDKSRWEHCERCDEHIRYVYVCQVDGEAKEWRIGSTCGPTLIAVSKAIWGETATAAKRDLVLLHRALRLKPLEEGPNTWGSARLGSDWVDRVATILKSGKTDGYTLQKVPTFRATDLKIIQKWLMLAERHHGLQRFQIGSGK